MKLLFSVALTLFVFSCNTERKISFYKVKCYNMLYACNGCGPQYKIKSVLIGDSIFKGKSLINKDVSIEFRKNEQEKLLDRVTSNCAICYDYIFYGNLESTSKDEYNILKVDSFEYTLRKNCCNK